MNFGTISQFLSGDSSDGGIEGDGTDGEGAVDKCDKDAFHTSSTAPVLQSFSLPSQVLTLHIENL